MRVVMLCGDGRSSRIMYNGLAEDVDIACVILESKPSSMLLIQRRLKRLGFFRTFGQLCFIIANKLLSRTAHARIRQLLCDYGLQEKEFPNGIVKRVKSVNDEETAEVLKRFNPDAVVVNGTRIISKHILSAVKAPFINTHMGITPRYRGVHGGYWALANDDGDNCGVTVHLVDQGIDTGGVLYQDFIHPDKRDSFNTYPIHQIAKAIPLMKAALNDAKEKKITIQQGVLPSQLWYHPTICQYILNWVKKGVK